MYKFSRKLLKPQPQDFMSAGMLFFKKINFDVQCFGTCARSGPHTTWAVVRTRIYFRDPLSLLATLITHIKCHNFAGPPMHTPTGCSCRTARLSEVGYQLKMVQEVYRYLGISHNSDSSFLCPMKERTLSSMFWQLLAELQCTVY